MRFALIGAAGYIAPRHMKAISDTGNDLVAAMDPFDSVGIIDSYFPEADFFTEFERFDRHLDKLRRNHQAIDFVSICSPNYLHDAHIRFGLRSGASVICEKPLVLNPWNVEAMMEIEKDSPGRVFNVLQLRLHPSIIELKRKVEMSDQTYTVDLKYITSRGKWYHYSWKGREEQSGGIVTNIGVHFFDMLLWIFGDCQNLYVSQSDSNTAKGNMKLEKADVSWHLSIDPCELPESASSKGLRTYRSITVNEEEFEFSGGFTDLHTKVYQDILSGGGFGLEDAMPAIRLVHRIRNFKEQS